MTEAPTNPSPPPPPGLDSLSREFMDSAFAADGGISKWKLVHQALNQLQDIVTRSGSGDTVFVFGGCISIGVWDGTQEVDFCAINATDWAKPNIHNPRMVTTHVPELKSIVPAQEHRVNQAISTLQAEGIDRRNITAVMNAHVPILRHHASAVDDGEGALRSLDFDLSFQGYGLRNSLLQRRYIMQNQCARLGAILVKKWAKENGLSDARSGYLSPDSFVILWLHYLLMKRKVLQFIPIQTIPTIPTGHILPEYSALSNRNDPKVRLELCDLLLGFFKYYHKEFNFETQVVSLSRPTVTSKVELGWTSEKQIVQCENVWELIHYNMCIEDPYEANVNLARRIDSDKMEGMVRLFTREYHRLWFKCQQKETVMVAPTATKLTTNDNGTDSDTPDEEEKRPVQPASKLPASLIGKYNPNAPPFHSMLFPSYQPPPAHLAGANAKAESKPSLPLSPPPPSQPAVKEGTSAVSTSLPSDDHFKWFGDSDVFSVALVDSLAALGIGSDRPVVQTPNALLDDLFLASQETVIHANTTEKFGVLLDLESPPLPSQSPPPPPITTSPAKGHRPKDTLLPPHTAQSREVRRHEFFSSYVEHSDDYIQDLWFLGNNELIRNKAVDIYYAHWSLTNIKASFYWALLTAAHWVRTSKAKRFVWHTRKNHHHSPCLHFNMSSAVCTQDKKHSEAGFHFCLCCGCTDHGAYICPQHNKINDRFNALSYKVGVTVAVLTDFFCLNEELAPPTIILPLQQPTRNKESSISKEQKALSMMQLAELGATKASKYETIEIDVMRNDFFTRHIQHSDDLLRDLWYVCNAESLRFKAREIHNVYWSHHAAHGVIAPFLWALMSAAHGIKSKKVFAWQRSKNTVTGCLYFNHDEKCCPNITTHVEQGFHFCLCCGSGEHGCHVCPQLKKIHKRVRHFATQLGVTLDSLQDFFGFGDVLPHSMTLPVAVRRAEGEGKADHLQRDKQQEEEMLEEEEEEQEEEENEEVEDDAASEDAEEETDDIEDYRGAVEEARRLVEEAEQEVVLRQQALSDAQSKLQAYLEESEVKPPAHSRTPMQEKKPSVKANGKKQMALEPAKDQKKSQQQQEKKRETEEAEKAKKAADKKRVELEMAALRKAEQERIAVERKAEQERIAAERKAEQERLAAEKRAEKLEQKRQQEEAQRLEQEQERKERQKAKAAEKAKQVEQALRAAKESEIPSAPIQPKEPPPLTLVSEEERLRREANAEGNKMQGNEAYKNGDYIKAIQHYSSAIQQAPHMAALYTNRASAYLKLKKYEKARSDADMAIQLKPDWARGYQRLSQILIAQENWGSAHEVLAKATALDPEDMETKESYQKVSALVQAKKAAIPPPIVYPLLLKRTILPAPWQKYQIKSGKQYYWNPLTKVSSWNPPPGFEEYEESEEEDENAQN